MDRYIIPPYIAEMFRLNFTREDVEAIRDALKDMINVVRVMVFTSKSKYECFSCEDTVKFVQIIKEHSPLIGDSHAVEIKIFDLSEARSEVEKYDVTRVPTILLEDGVIRYVGMPAGEEIKSFIETLIRISTQDHGLSNNTVEELSSIKEKIVIETVVTPPCPYCPYAALLANMFAYVSKIYGNGNIESHIIEAYENPDIADKYAVSTVPTIAINNRVVFVGVPYETQLLKAVKRFVKIR